MQPEQQSQPQPDVEQMMEQARAMERRVVDGQRQLLKTAVTGRSADGTVTVLAHGMGKIQTVRVDPTVYDRRDPVALQTAIMEAVHAVGVNASRLAEQKLGMPADINPY